MKVLYGALALVLTVANGVHGDPITVVSTLIRPADPTGWAVTAPMADSFVAAFDGYLYSLTAVLTLHDGFFGPPASTATLAIYTDQGGLPAVPLEVLTVTGFVPDAGRDSDEPYIKTAQSLTQPLLNSGTTYWFVVSGVGGVVNFGAGFPCCNWPHAFYRDGVWTVDKTFPGAFIVIATPQNSVAPVPEPATLILLSCGTLVAMVERRRRYGPSPRPEYPGLRG